MKSLVKQIKSWKKEGEKRIKTYRRAWMEHDGGGLIEITLSQNLGSARGYVHALEQVLSALQKEETK